MRKRKYSEKELFDLTLKVYECYVQNDFEEAAYYLYQSEELALILLNSMKTSGTVDLVFYTKVEEEYKRMKQDDIQIERDRRRNDD